MPLFILKFGCLFIRCRLQKSLHGYKWTLFVLLLSFRRFGWKNTLSWLPRWNLSLAILWCNLPLWISYWNYSISIQSQNVQNIPQPILGGNIFSDILDWNSSKLIPSRNLSLNKNLQFFYQKNIVSGFFSF